MQVDQLATRNIAEGDQEHFGLHVYFGDEEKRIRALCLAAGVLARDRKDDGAVVAIVSRGIEIGKNDVGRVGSAEFVVGDEFRRLSRRDLLGNRRAAGDRSCECCKSTLFYAVLVRSTFKRGWCSNVILVLSRRLTRRCGSIVH